MFFFQVGTQKPRELQQINAFSYVAADQMRDNLIGTEKMPLRGTVKTMLGSMGRL